MEIFILKPENRDVKWCFRRNASWELKGLRVKTRHVRQRGMNNLSIDDVSLFSPRCTFLHVFSLILVKACKHDWLVLTCSLVFFIILSCDYQHLITKKSWFVDINRAFLSFKLTNWAKVDARCDNWKIIFIIVIKHIIDAENTSNEVFYLVPDLW